MSLNVTKTGDWSKALQFFERIKSIGILPIYKTKLSDLGEKASQMLQEHIRKQDLSWTPLSQSTITVKNGDNRIFIDTGTLMNNLKVCKVTSSSNDLSIFIGVDPDVSYEDGTKISDVLIYMEYGTSNMVARPLFRPTKEELTPMFTKECKEILKDILSEGV